MTAHKSRSDHASTSASPEYLEERRQLVREYRRRISPWLIWVADPDAHGPTSVVPTVRDSGYLRSHPR